MVNVLPAAAAATDGQEWWGTHDSMGGPGVSGWQTATNLGISMNIPSTAITVDGYTTTLSSATAITLVYTSTSVQVVTGSTVQTVNLPTTSVTTNMAWLIVNNSSASITVHASGGATVSTVAANAIGTFVAAANTPTTAAGWNTYFQKTLTASTFNGWTEGVQVLGTLGSTVTIGALPLGTVATATLAASTASTITLPTIGAGQGLIVDLTQCGSGTGGTYTFVAAGGQTLKWSGGSAPTATATNSKIDRLVFGSSDGTNVLATATQNF